MDLVADETREGDVYRRLLEKLEQARQALGGPVFDVLGKLEFEGAAAARAAARRHPLRRAAGGATSSVRLPTRFRLYSNDERDIARWRRAETAESP